MPTEPLYRVSVLRRILAEHDLKPTKSLGQNFLIDQNTLDRIVSAADLSSGDTVLEIGPGLGVLTQALLGRGAHVVAIEKDERLVAVLSRLFDDEPSLTLLHADALTVDLAAVLGSAVEGERRPKVVANLPYYVTSPLLMHLLEAPISFERLVIMIQQEVAARLLARPGTKEYGALTVAVAYYAQVESVGIVPPTVFYPAPTVSSQIVKLVPRSYPYDVGNKELFFQIVRAAFGKRRKTLQNALKSLPLSGELIRSSFAGAQIDPTRRGETLSPEEFARLSATLSSL